MTTALFRRLAQESLREAILELKINHIKTQQGSFFIQKTTYRVGFVICYLLFVIC